MTILCGTDFSASAVEAAHTAALLARRLDTDVTLVHVVTELGAELLMGTDQEHTFDRQKEQLEAEAARLRELDARVTTRFATGHPDEVLAKLAAETDAQLVVVGSLGRRAPGRWLVGSVAERASQVAPAPVLVVRAGSVLDEWLRGSHRLHVALGVDLTGSAATAIRWLHTLRKLGPCDVTAIHVAWPPGEHARLGVDGPMDLVSLRPEIEDVLRRDVTARIGALPGEGAVRIVVRPGFGRADRHLVRLAEEAGADLLVVGSHQRSRLARFWSGSVSRGALHLAPFSVVTVPMQAAHDLPVTTPDVRSVLAASDLSPIGDQAVRWAYAMVPRGGTVHLVHVVPPPARREASTPTGEEAVAALRRLVPVDATAHGVATDIRVLEAEEPADAICAAAERLGADAICVGSHGRSGLTATLAGSVAQKILGRSRRPVLVVRPPEE